MSTSHKQQLINNTLWVYAGKVITQVLGLVATVLVIRKLPVEMYGTYTFLFGLFFVYQLFVTSPIKNVLLRYVPELYEKGASFIVRKLVIYSQVFAMGFIAVFSFLLYLFKNEFSGFFHIESFDTHFKAFTVFVFCYALKVLSETIIASFLKHPVSTKANVLVVVVRASSYLVMLSSITVNMLLYIEAIVSVLFVLFVLKSILKELFKRSGENIGDYTGIVVKGRILRFYFLTFFSELGYGIIGKTSDQYIVAAISSPFYVGLYGFALKIFEMFYKVLPFREFESVLKPVFFKRFSNLTGEKEINEFYNFSIKILLPLFIFPALYFMVFGKGIIVHVFDEKYLPAYWVTCVLLVGLIFHGLFYPLNLVIQLKERVEINLYSRIVVVFSVVAGVYAMKLWGVVGVAAATVAGELLKNIFMLLLLRRHISVKYSKSIFIRYGILIAVFTIGFLPIAGSFASLFGLLTGSFVFVVVWLMLVVNIHPLNNLELRKLKGLVCESEKLESACLKLVPIINMLRIYRG